jgi:hypothetical protein
MPVAIPETGPSLDTLDPIQHSTFSIAVSGLECRAATALG